MTDRNTVCGANKYFYKNGTIAFIVTGDMNCQVRLTLTSNVQITSRLMVPIDSFYSNGGIATFIDMMCAYLNITTNRMKVVGVTSGSTIVDYQVTSTINTTTDNSTTATSDPQSQMNDLQTILDKAVGAPSNVLGSLGPIGSTTGQINIVNTDGSLYTTPVQPPSTETSIKTTIIVAVVVSILSVTLIGVTSYLVLKKLRTRERI